MQHRLKCFPSLKIALMLGFCTFMSGCGSGYDKDFPSSIWATGSTVRVSQTLQLGTETGVTGSPLTYWVNGVKGGNAQFGTVDSSDLYTAPALFRRLIIR
jgi:hypothetical protein